MYRVECVESIPCDVGEKTADYIPGYEGHICKIDTSIRLPKPCLRKGSPQVKGTDKAASQRLALDRWKARNPGCILATVTHGYTSQYFSAATVLNRCVWDSDSAMQDIGEVCSIFPILHA